MKKQITLKRFALNKAFTLLEVIIVSCIVSFTIGGIITMLNTARKTQYNAEIISQMSLTANSELVKWNAKEDHEIIPGTFYTNQTSDKFTTGTVKITEFQDTGLLEITVTVKRKTQKGERKVVFTTLR
jgi:type II secretory pathway pseudopilin PulG